MFLMVILNGINADGTKSRGSIGEVKTGEGKSFIIAVVAIFVVIGVIWYFKYQKKQVIVEQEIKAQIAERELLEKAKKIKEEMANKQ